MSMLKVEVLRAACCVAGVDGTISPQEMAWLTKLAHAVGVGEVSLKAMMERARTDSNYAADQFRFLQKDTRETMRVLLGVAVADGKLADREREVLAQLSKKLGVGDADLEKYIAVAESHIARRTDASPPGKS